MAAPAYPPISACEELVGNPRYQVIKFHEIADQSGQHHPFVDHFRINQSAVNRFGDRVRSEKEGNEIEKGGKDHRHSRRQHTGRNHCGDGIGSVVKSVGVIKSESQDNDKSDKHKSTVHTHLCL